MRIKELFLATIGAVTLLGCGGATGDLESCATVYSGTFTGEASGVVTTLLQQDGTMFVYLREDNGTNYDSSESSVDENGIITSGQLEGTFDFDTCTAEGTWTEGTSSGTFELHDPTL